MAKKIDRLVRAGGSLELVAVKKILGDHYVWFALVIEVLGGIYSPNWYIRNPIQMSGGSTLAIQLMCFCMFGSGSSSWIVSE